MTERAGETVLAMPASNGLQPGPYILREIQVDPPLTKTAKHSNSQVTCVEFWNDNLYIGTSAAEILHYVLIPSEAEEEARFTFASGSQLSEGPNPPDPTIRNDGVQQILILPRAGKACIHCNGFLTFCSLPELSPGFASNSVVKCTWIGGLDLDASEDESELETIILCHKNYIALVGIDEKMPRKGPRLRFPNSVTTVRRGNIVCVANAESYSLLDIGEEGGQIPLFDISTAAIEDAADTEPQSVQAPSSAEPAVTRQLEQSHSRSASLGDVALDRERSQSPQNTATHSRSQSTTDFPTRSSSLLPRLPPLSRTPSPLAEVSKNEPPESSPEKTTVPAASPYTPAEKSTPTKPQLRPHIASHTPGEFLLTTGISNEEPGVGMFVNLDGDPVRGTIGFTKYPQALVVDGSGLDEFTTTATVSSASNEGYILAVVYHTENETVRRMLEIQRWDVEAGDLGAKKHWLSLNQNVGSETQAPRKGTAVAGIRTVTSESDISLPSVIEKLALRRLGSRKDTASSSSPTRDRHREKTEIQLVSEVSSFKSSLLTWSDNQLYWIVRNPLLLRLDSQLMLALREGSTTQNSFVNRQIVEQTLNTIRGQEAQAPLEFFTLKYIRQKASLSLFMDLLSLMSSTQPFTERDRKVTEEALSEGEIDPRIVLTMLPILRDEVIEGTEGIWVQGGLESLIYRFLHHVQTLQRKSELQGFDESVLQLIKRYLFIWRQKKGFESIPNSKEISQSVDAALLHLLLILDSEGSRGSAPKNPIRSELNSVVSKGIDCFERGVELLESFHRLYELSLLYNHYRMHAKVLETWRRILNGERDDGGGFSTDQKGTDIMCEFLAKHVADESLVREYGVMLAKRDSRLGVRVFGNTNAKTKVKFAPEEAIEILREGAPSAVKDFIEHLVFEKNLASFANTLISFYLDSVLSAIESEPEPSVAGTTGRGTDQVGARTALAESYVAYRALQPPKLTYNQFVADNLPSGSEWARNRLRLLQLLGGSHGTASQYDVKGILERIQPYADLLIPETIVLAGRQDQHGEALRLLTHGLGDLDTAIRYCVFGGGSMYGNSGGNVSSTEERRPSREEQAALFGHLLEEFINIEDEQQRIRQTSQLLERYAAFFSVAHVLSRVPESWSLESIANFLHSALRALLAERRETALERALISVENLNVSAAMIEKLSSIIPIVQRELSETAQA